MCVPDYFIGTGGLKLYTKSWLTKTPRANVLILHGYLEHCGRYATEAYYLNNHAYNVYSYDQRGHGLSEGIKSYIQNFEDLVTDFKLFLNTIKTDNDRPYYIFGHSMGCLVLLSYLIAVEKDPNLKGVVLSAPFIMASKELAPFLQKISHVLGIILPKLKVLASDPKEISRDPRTVKSYSEDPLIYHDKVHARSAQQLLKQMKKIRPHYSSINLPLLIMHGTHNKLAEIEGSRLLFHESSSSDKQFIPLKDFKHEITREIGKSNVLQTIANWLDERLYKELT